MPKPSDLIYQTYFDTARSRREQVETLPRLAELCDDILSGRAYALALQSGADANSLRARRVTHGAVRVYISLRGWRGPHPLTLRQKYGQYVRARTSEFQADKADD